MRDDLTMKKSWGCIEDPHKSLASLQIPNYCLQRYTACLCRFTPTQIEVWPPCKIHALSGLSDFLFEATANAPKEETPLRLDFWHKRNKVNTQLFRKNASGGVESVVNGVRIDRYTHRSASCLGCIRAGLASSATGL